MPEGGNMLSEMILMGLVMSVSIQSSSLWASLLIVPLSVLVFLNFSPDKSSGVIFLLLIMIFLGGLLVLLVSVASAVHQEQISMPEATLTSSLFILSILFMASSWYYSWDTFSSMSLFSWGLWLMSIFFTFVLMVLLFSLVVISTLLMEFKGMIRKL